MITKVEILEKSLKAVRKGLKPMRAKIFLPLFGEALNQYTYDGHYFSTLESFKEFLEGYEVIDGKPNIFLIFGDE